MNKSMPLLNQLEQPNLELGFMALTDCAPLVVAKEMGFFDKWGLSVSLQKQNSWATLRDKVHAGLLDAAQMLAPMPIASNYGLDCLKTAVIAPMVLSRNGNAITLSKRLYEDILTEQSCISTNLPFCASYLKSSVMRKKKTGTKLRLAAVFPYSCHYYQLVSWLRTGGIKETDVDIVIIPPANMVLAMAAGDIDGFCVGGPWNADSVRQQVGFTGITSSDIWPGTPEKVLGMLATWQNKRPYTVQALIMSLKESCEWLESIPNRFEAAKILTKTCYLNTSLDVIAPSLMGSCLTYHNTPPRSVPAYHQFALLDERIGNCPSTVDGHLLFQHMIAAKHVLASSKPALNINDIFNSDIYHQSLDSFSHNLLADSKFRPVMKNVRQALKGKL